MKRSKRKGKCPFLKRNGLVGKVSLSFEEVGEDRRQLLSFKKEEEVKEKATWISLICKMVV